jgi:hypothetical protein
MDGFTTESDQIRINTMVQEVARIAAAQIADLEEYLDDVLSDEFGCIYDLEYLADCLSPARGLTLAEYRYVVLWSMKLRLGSLAKPRPNSRRQLREKIDAGLASLGYCPIAADRNTTELTRFLAGVTSLYRDKVADKPKAEHDRIAPVVSVGLASRVRANRRIGASS